MRRIQILVVLKVQSTFNIEKLGSDFTVVISTQNIRCQSLYWMSTVVMIPKSTVGTLYALSAGQRLLSIVWRTRSASGFTSDSTHPNSERGAFVGLGVPPPCAQHLVMAHMGGLFKVPECKWAPARLVGPPNGPQRPAMAARQWVQDGFPLFYCL